MSFKFDDNDIFHSTIKAYPKYSIHWKHNNAYINNRNWQGQNVYNGVVSLYEMNVDRTSDQLISGSIRVGENSSKYLVTKNTGTSSISSSSELTVGDDLSIPYPITAQITRELVIAERVPGPDISGVDIRTGVTEQDTVFNIVSLKNTYNHYRATSPYYDFDQYVFQYGGVPVTREAESLPRNDYTNMILIPAIMYGEEIKKGSLDLKFYYTGSLLARAQDTNQNGELIETVGPNVGSVIGMALYNEGVLLITASYDLHSLTDGYLSPKSGSVPEGTALDSDWIVTSSWAHFGAYNSYITSSTDPASSSYAPINSSYTLEYKGKTRTPVVTMLAHAKKNELNWSNNPTFLAKSDLTASYKESFVKVTGSNIYLEDDNIAIKNTVSSSYYGYEEKFKSQTFISKIGIYNEENELIAVAKLATPVRKTNDQDYTFKLKLDL
jgi:hypothetical protein